MGSSATGTENNNDFTSISVGTIGSDGKRLDNEVTGDGTHGGGGNGQIHVWGRSGDDTIGLAFRDVTTFTTGHHARGDQKYFTNGLYADTFNFKDLHEIKNGGIAVGRVEDFDLTRDTIQIEGNVIDLTQGSGVEAGFSWKVVMWDADPNDSATGEQQWLYIDTGSGHLFYALEGARVAPNGDGGANAIYDNGVRVGGAQEDHFIKEANLPLDFASLTAVGFVDPENHVPLGAVAQGGITINDYDDSEVPVYNEDGVLTLPGGDLSTPISGSAFGDLIAAGLNDDSVNAGDGNDHVWGGSGHDVVYGQAGNDTLEGGTGHDLLNAGSGFDSLTGGAGNDTLQGGTKDDTLVGGTGDDSLFGQDDNDHLDGEGGSDILNGGGGNDSLYAGSGDDFGKGGTGNDFLSGQKGDDSLYGNSGNDTLWGGSGDDIVNGGGGDDRLVGGADNDYIKGGTGADVFVFSDGSGQDRVVDFDPTQANEYIDLSAVSSITSYSDLINNHVSDTGAALVIDAGGGNTITLEGVASISLLSADDFVF